MAEPEPQTAQTTEQKDFELEAQREYEVFPTSAVAATYACGSFSAPSYVEEARAAVDICAVVDRSGSMSGKKMQLVKQTLEFVSLQLSKDDKFGVVSFDTGVRTDMKLMKMDADQKTALGRKIKQIKAGSSTNLSGGLFKGLDELKATEGSSKVRSVWLLTDGLANHGISKSDELQKALKSKLESHQNAQVFTFGYGDDHDDKMLKGLAETGSAMYYYVENPDDIATSFADCLGGLLSVCAQNITLTITPQNGCKFKKMLGKIAHDVKDGVCTMELGDMYSEERRNLVCLFELPESDETDEFVVATYKVDFFNVVGCKNATIERKLVVKRKKDVPKEQTRENSLELQINRIRVADAIEEANKVGSSDLKQAQEILEAAITKLKASPMISDPLCAELLADLEEIRGDMKDRATYRSKASKKMGWKMQKHRRERAVADKTGGNYSNKAKSAMKSKSSNK